MSQGKMRKPRCCVFLECLNSQCHRSTVEDGAKVKAKAKKLISSIKAAHMQDESALFWVVVFTP